MFNRPKGFCPCCSQVVEWYSDGLSGGGHPYRCGNCFHGISEGEWTRLAKLQIELNKLDEQREKMLKSAQLGA